MNMNDRLKKLLPIAKKYKYIVLVLAVGVVLLLLPPLGKQAGSAQAPPTETEEDFSVAALEERLAATLSEIEGVGQAQVVLTVKGGMRRVLAEDGGSTKRGEGERDENRNTVVISTGSGTQEAVLVQQLYPQFQGALIVCPGGENPAIRLKLIEAVAALTGLGSNKISICKGK